MLQWNPFLQGDDIDFSRTVFSFAKEKILPSTEYRDEKEIWDDEIWKEISKAGLAGLPIPVEYGGQGASCFQSCLATESFW
jgi:alkylation response protein AidB-like acyl-CoA dehydrogenase